MPGHPNIFVIGDTAHARRRDGKPLPGVAPVAKQQGQYVAKLLIARADGKDAAAVPLSRLRLAGDDRPQARRRRRSGGCRLTGFIAWLLWCVAHIYFLIGFRNRLIVALNWLWNYLTFQRGTRLITGMSGARMDDMRAPQRKKPPLRGAA